MVPAVETLVSVKGTLDDPVHDLCFEGLTFKHSNWIRAYDHGYLNLQAGQYTIEPTNENVQYIGRPPAAVYVACAHHIVFEKNVFTELGATALDFHYASHDNEIAGNVFYDIAGSGISLAKFADEDCENHAPYNSTDEREICRNEKIHNNYLTQVGLDYGGCIGIVCGWPQAVMIDHNELKDLAYTGISVGWGWTHEPSVMKNNKIRWNRIDHPMSLHADGGGIYTLSEMPGSLIYRNYIFNLKRSAWAVGASVKGLHLDEGSGGITVQENLLVGDATIERIRLHQNGLIICKPKMSSMYPGIIKEAGLEQEYQDIKNVIK